jgi:hypothetical protein
MHCLFLKKNLDWRHVIHLNYNKKIGACTQVQIK